MILGKTNLSEWANFRGQCSVSGWSSRGGLTRNPYALDRTACGSSSGSGVAVAANLCAAAIGTETDGSIICPAQTNGIVGIKPTLGLVSRSGIIPIAYSQDTAGPMARTVTDAALLLGAADGSGCKGFSHTCAQKTGAASGHSISRAGRAEGARIALRARWRGRTPTSSSFESCIEVLKHLGAVVIDPADVPNFKKLDKCEREVFYFEFKADLNKYPRFAWTKAPVRSMEDVIRFNEAHKAQVMPYFGQERMETAQGKGPLSSKTYRGAGTKSPAGAQRRH